MNTQGQTYLFSNVWLCKRQQQQRHKQMFCGVITPERLFMWVFRFREFIYVGVIKTVVSVTGRTFFGTVPQATNKRKQIACKT